MVTGGAAPRRSRCADACIPHLRPVIQGQDETPLQTAELLGQFLEPVISSKEVFLLAVVAVFLVLGFVMEGVASMIMLVPVVAPMARMFGVDGYHLALVIVMTVQIALVTPPLAIGLYLVCPMAGCTVKEVSIEVLPFIGVILAVILAVVFFPQIASSLPAALGY